LRSGSYEKINDREMVVLDDSGIRQPSFFEKVSALHKTPQPYEAAIQTTETLILHTIMNMYLLEHYSFFSTLINRI